jgi:hypothetical protein
MSGVRKDTQETIRVVVKDMMYRLIATLYHYVIKDAEKTALSNKKCFCTYMKKKKVFKYEAASCFKVLFLFSLVFACLLACPLFLTQQLDGHDLDIEKYEGKKQRSLKCE